MRQGNSASTCINMQTHNEYIKLTKTICLWAKCMVPNDANNNIPVVIASFKRTNQKCS